MEVADDVFIQWTLKLAPRVQFVYEYVCFECELETMIAYCLIHNILLYFIWQLFYI